MLSNRLSVVLSIQHITEWVQPQFALSQDGWNRQSDFACDRRHAGQRKFDTLNLLGVLRESLSNAFIIFLAGVWCHYIL